MQSTASKHWAHAHRVLWVLILVVASTSRLASAMTRVALPPTGIGRSYDLMGQAVALSQDTALVGAPDALPVPYLFSGAVEAFRLVGGEWESEAVLSPSNAVNGMQFGAAVALDQDLAVIVAAPQSSVTWNAYTFERAGAAWLEISELPFSSYGRAEMSVALSGQTLALADVAGAKIYLRSGAGWTTQASLNVDQTSQGETIVGVALEGDLALVLSIVPDGSFSVDQYAYFFSRSAGVWTREAKIDLGTYFGLARAVAALSDQTAIIGTAEANQTGLVRAFVRDQGTWSQQGVLDPGTALSAAVALTLEGDRAVVGSPSDTVLGYTFAGTAYVFERSGGSWMREAHIYDPAVGDFFYAFGTSVSLSGETVLVGSPGANTDAGASGKALVFDLDAGSWNFTAGLDDGDWHAGEGFGWSVSFSGSTLLVGTPGEQRENAFSSGGAHVLERSGDQWVESAKLEPTSDATQDFGSAVALDGDTAAVGARLDEHFGAVYVFARNGTSWPLQARLVSGSSQANGYFGWAVALEGDLLAAGEPNGANPQSSDAGQVYLFERSGTDWSPPITIQPADSSAGDEFGISVAVSGATMIVGAPAADIGIESNAGAAYVFTRSGSGWDQQAQLLAPIVAAQAGFGASVALVGDMAIVGASSSDRGAAYVYVRDGEIWSWQATLTPPLSLPLPPSFGQSLALSADQNLVLVGMPYGTPDDPYAGLVFEFARNGADWIPVSTLHGSPPSAPFPVSDYFGSALDFDGSNAVIGAPGDGDGSSGAVYVASLGDNIFSSGFEPAP